MHTAEINLTCKSRDLVVELLGSLQARRAAVHEASRRQYSTPLAELAITRPAAPEVVPEPMPAAQPERAEVCIPTLALAPAAPSTPVSAITPSAPGRGGKQHKYLQSLIKQIGEDRDFRATVEKAVLDGSGSIDVVLEREGCAVACEISVTTPTEYEIGNLAKGLEAGFDLAVLVSTDKRHSPAFAKARPGRYLRNNARASPSSPPKRCRRFWTRSRPQSGSRRSTDIAWQLNTKHSRPRSKLPARVPCET